MAQVKTLRQIPDSEQFSPKVEHLPGKKIRATFSFRRDKDSPRFEKVCLFDFSTMSEAEVLELALKSALIRVQGMIRQLPPEQMLSVDALSVINVKADVIDAPSKVTDPLSSAVKSMMKLGLSEEDARAAVENARMKAEGRRNEGKRRAA